MTRVLLQEVKERLRAMEGGLSAEATESFRSHSIPGGITRGVLCEVTGSARTEWMIDFLKENSEEKSHNKSNQDRCKQDKGLSALWVEEQLTLLPTALEQRGVALSRVLFVEAGGDVFRAVRKGLKSSLFSVVVLPGESIQVARSGEEIKFFKALQLLCRESGATVFFLSKEPRTAWAIQLQLKVDWVRASLESPLEYEVEILKQKAGSYAADRLSLG